MRDLEIDERDGVGSELRRDEARFIEARRDQRRENEKEGKKEGEKIRTWGAWGWRVDICILGMKGLP